MGWSALLPSALEAAAVAGPEEDACRRKDELESRDTMSEH